MFIPLPSPEVCDHSSQTAIHMAQMIARTWHNFDPRPRTDIPESIIFHPDGTGTISTSHEIFSRQSSVTETYTHGFKWKLARSGPMGMEDMSFGTLFDTFPKLARSTNAWTYRTWEEGLVATYIRLELTGLCSFEGLPFRPPDAYILSSDTTLPLELIDYIFELASAESYTVALKLSATCTRVRELCQRQHRRIIFKEVARRFANYGMAIYMNCGHYDPTLNKSRSHLYGISARMFKWPEASRYPTASPEVGNATVSSWQDRIYYSCRLPLPEPSDTTAWQRMMGERAYDSHPEIEKRWT